MEMKLGIEEHTICYLSYAKFGADQLRGWYWSPQIFRNRLHTRDAVHQSG